MTLKAQERLFVPLPEGDFVVLLFCAIKQGAICEWHEFPLSDDGLYHTIGTVKKIVAPKLDSV